jgi:hypothetical protein
MGGRNLRRALRLLALEDSTARAAAIDTPVARYRLYTTRCAVMPREFRRRRQPEIGRLQRARYREPNSWGQLPEVPGLLPWPSSEFDSVRLDALVAEDQAASPPTTRPLLRRQVSA